MKGRQNVNKVNVNKVNTVNTRTTIRPENVEKVRHWYATRGGAGLWTSKDLGACRPPMLAPMNDKDGQPAGAPHWAYVGHAEPIQPSDIIVTQETRLPLPIDKQSACPTCNGVGRRTLASLAKIRNQTVESLKAEIAADDWTAWGKDHDGTSFPCPTCDSTGKVRPESIKVRVKREYWGGLTVSDAGKKKAQVMVVIVAQVHGKASTDVKWDFEYVGGGIAEIYFYVEEIFPFTLADAPASDEQEPERFDGLS